MALVAVHNNVAWHERYRATQLQMILQATKAILKTCLNFQKILYITLDAGLSKRMIRCGVTTRHATPQGRKYIFSSCEVNDLHRSV